MEIKESYDLPLPIDVVWQALNDENFLKNSIPGCEKLDRNSPTELTAIVKLKESINELNQKGRERLVEAFDKPSFVIIWFLLNPISQSIELSA